MSTLFGYTIKALHDLLNFITASYAHEAPQIHTPKDFASFMEVPEIFTLVTRHLDVSDMLALCTTRKTFGQLMTSDKWDLFDLLQRYQIDNRPLFLNVLARTGSFLSGPAVFDFITCGTGADRVLEIRCSLAAQNEWYSFLRGEGYILLSAIAGPPLLTAFCQAGAHGAHSRATIFLIACDNPIMRFLKSMSATFEGTIVTWNEITTIWPHETFIDKRHVLLKPPSNATGDALNSYGVHFTSLNHPSLPRYTSWKTRDMRYLGDSHCLSIKLDIRGFTPPPEAFKFRRDEFFVGGLHPHPQQPEIIVARLEHALLSGVYNSYFALQYVADASTGQMQSRVVGGPLCDVYERLDKYYAWQVITTVPESERPASLLVDPAAVNLGPATALNMRPTLGAWPVIIRPNWKYWDDEVPRLLEECKRDAEAA